METFSAPQIVLADILYDHVAAIAAVKFQSPKEGNAYLAQILVCSSLFTIISFRLDKREWQILILKGVALTMKRWIYFMESNLKKKKKKAGGLCNHEWLL